MRRRMAIRLTMGTTIGTGHTAIGMGTLAHMIIAMTGRALILMSTITRTAMIMTTIMTGATVTATRMATIIRIATTMYIVMIMRPPPAGRRSIWSAACSPIMTSTPP